MYKNEPNMSRIACVFEFNRTNEQLRLIDYECGCEVSVVQWAKGVKNVENCYLTLNDADDGLNMTSHRFQKI